MYIHFLLSLHSKSTSLFFVDQISVGELHWLKWMHGSISCKEAECAPEFTCFTRQISEITNGIKAAVKITRVKGKVIILYVI